MRRLVLLLAIAACGDNANAPEPTGCHSVGDCPGTDTECAQRTCTEGVCGIAFAPMGTPTTMQVAGDCHASVCDGGGNIASIVDDADVPDDHESCTVDTCTSGTPANTPLDPGTTCGSGLECDGAGHCVHCVAPDECPGADTDCQVRACTAGVCGFAFVAQGTPLSTQVAGDCQQLQCDGAGGTQHVADDGDLPDDSNVCTTDICTNGVPSHDNVAQGTTCDTNAICDGSGNCIAECGDGIAEGTEDCDGTDLRAQTCPGLGFTAGTLACTATCTYDTSGCTTCGNGIAETGEPCDGSDLAGATCQSLGFQHGTLACTPTCTFDTSGCSTCGDDVISGNELCDGTALGTASCTSLGHAPGTLACNATCDGYVVTGCDGGFVAANAGFAGNVCDNGLSYNGNASYLAACTTDQGVWKLPFTGGGAGTWFNNDGLTVGQQVTVLHGHAIYAQADVPAVIFYTDPDPTTGVNAWRTNTFAAATAATPSTWPTTMQGQTALSSGGFPVQVYSVHPGSSTNSVWGGWHQVLGAIVQHGANLNTATLNQVNPGATGTVTSVGVSCCAPGANPMPSTDINIAMFGQQPDGTPGTGGGIYWACDISGLNGGHFVEHDTGIADADKPLVFTLIPDNSTFATTNTRTCPQTGSTVVNFATTWYAGLRGGGQIYKTTDAGQTWVQSNVGLPPGAEVFGLAIDCFVSVPGTPATCVNPNLLYAATSLGLWSSSDAGATWSLAGFENTSVRSVVLIPHAVGTTPPIYVGVDDAVHVYTHP